MMLRLLLICAAVIVLAGCSRYGKPGEGDAVYVHTVEEGESLQDIADDYYGDPARAEWLRDFNDLEDAPLKVGSDIRVPMNEKDLERRKQRELAQPPYNAGLAQAEKGAYLEAVQYFIEALEVDDDFIDAHYNLGVTYQKLKQYDKALGELKVAARARPDAAEYQFALGTSYFYLQKYRDASGAFETAIEIDPTYRKAQYSLAISYEKLNQHAKARQAWLRYLEIDRDSVWAVEAQKHLDDLQ